MLALHKEALTNSIIEKTENQGGIIYGQTHRKVPPPMPFKKIHQRRAERLLFFKKT
jgi:hypothetical protein